MNEQTINDLLEWKKELENELITFETKINTLKENQNKLKARKNILDNVAMRNQGTILSTSFSDCFISNISEQIQQNKEELNRAEDDIKLYQIRAIIEEIDRTIEKAKMSTR